MASSFSQLKSNREKAIETLTNEAKKVNSKTSTEFQKDDRFWSLTVDKAGNGHAVIRFLAAPQGEDVPWVRVWDHGFKGPGGWYIENSLTTLGLEDPVSEFNSVLWNKNNDKDCPFKQQARDQKRRLHYITNILVIKDPANPENDGKVFLFKFGKKIFDKLNALMNPEFEGDEAVNPFDMWIGRDFRLKARKVSGYRNYDESAFSSNPTQIAKTDDEIEKLWLQAYPLQDFINPSQFKSYEELNSKLRKVLQLDRSSSTVEERSTFERKPTAAAPKLKEAEPDEEDSDLSFFEKLAEDDE